jgi:hypothetical protein
MKKLILSFVVGSLCAGSTIYADDEATLNQAISALNGRAKTESGQKLVLMAVSQQTNVPEKTLQSQMSTTHLGYGELLTANSLAQGGGKNLNSILAMKQGKGWAQLSKEVKIDPNSIVNRLRAAEKTTQSGQVNKTQAGNVKKATGVNKDNDSGFQNPESMGGRY